MKTALRSFRNLAIVLAMATSLGCSNGRGSVENSQQPPQQQQPSKVTIGGTVAGLAGGGLTLQNNGGDDLAVNANGGFSFATLIDAGAAYNVTVKTQPASPSQTCTVANASGTATTANVTTVTVTCTTGVFSVGGSVSGLAGNGLVLRNNGRDDLPIASNGSFTFATTLQTGATFEVTVAAQPNHPAQTCTVANASGAIGTTSVQTVRVSCATNTYPVRVAVSGLEGSGLVLQNNGGDGIGVETSGSFAFPHEIASGAAYSVSVKSQPTRPTQACSIQNGAGTIEDHPVDVTVTCATREFTIGGTVDGLRGSGLVLVNNGGDPLNVTADGPFTFPTAVLSGRPYNVTISSTPIHPLQVCNVSNGAGVVGDSNVTNVSVDCFRIGFDVGGTVSGLSGAGLKLQLNSSETLEIAANGSFLLPASLPDGSPYRVTVAKQPANQMCTVANGTGAIDAADAASVAVICRSQ